MKEHDVQRGNWLYLINQMLAAADAPALCRAYYLLLGFLGGSVSDPGTE